MQTAKLDISVQIKQDIRDTETFYEKMKQATTADDAKRWFNLLIWELSRYMVAEEIVLLPLYEKLGDSGKAFAIDCRRQHQNLKEMLVDTKKKSPKRDDEDLTDFYASVDYIMKTLFELFKLEETTYLPYLEENLSQEERESAGSRYAQRKKIAPTRPHQGMPDKPSGLEAAVSLLVSPVDKIRDMFRHFPKDKLHHQAPAG